MAKPKGKRIDQARAVSCEEVESPGKGNPGVKVTFAELDEEGDKLEGDYTIEKWFTGGALEYTINMLKACGCTSDEIANADFSGVGRNVVSLTLDGEGPNVAFVNAIGGAMGKPATDKADFARRLRAIMGTPDPIAKAAPAPPEDGNAEADGPLSDREPAFGEEGSDDLPF